MRADAYERFPRMTHGRLLSFTLLFLVGSGFSLTPRLGVRPAAAAPPEPLTLADFDAVAGETFSFKDDKGTLFTTSAGYQEPDRGHYLGVRYEVVHRGWAGWGLALKGLDASAFGVLTLDIKGERGGETCEIGLRDTVGREQKFPMTRFGKVTTSWTRLTIALAAFEQVNRSSLDNMTLGFNDRFGSGKIFVDNLRFEGGALGGGATTPAPKGETVLIDGFDRTNPFDVYQTYQSDDSTIDLAGSRILYQGDYSMEVTYALSTTRPLGTWVAARRTFPQLLDWTRGQTLNLWVKGDGSHHAFEIRLMMEGGATWIAHDDDILSFTRWTPLVVPLRSFTPLAPSQTGQMMALSAIRMIEFRIMSSTSRLTTGAKTAQGRIWLDALMLETEPAPTPEAPAAPAPMAPPAVPTRLRVSGGTLGHIDLSAVGFTEYFRNPDEKSQVNHNEKIIVNAKSGVFSLKADIASRSQEFGSSAVLVSSRNVTTVNREPDVFLPSLQLMANNLSPYFSNATLGNLFVDYSPYTFSPVFGFKGLSLEGDYERLNYHVFALKHRFNSFTMGTRWQQIWPNLRLSSIGVYWEGDARLPNTTLQGSDGTLSTNPAIISLQKTAQDFVYTFEARSRVWSDQLTLTGLYGYNQYKQTALTDFSDPFNPVFLRRLERPLTPDGRMYRGKAELTGVPWSGLTAGYEYRAVSTEFKPRYRQDQAGFDDLEGDQNGHNIRLVQRYQGWAVTVEHDRIIRDSNHDFFRRRTLWGIGYYGFVGMDIAFNQEIRREVYKFTSNRSVFTIDRNEEIVASELSLRKQYTPKVASYTRFRQERIRHPVTNVNFTNDSLQFRLEYAPVTNVKVLAEHKVTQFGLPALEPHGFPFADNFTRVSIELLF